MRDVTKSGLHPPPPKMASTAAASELPLPADAADAAAPTDAAAAPRKKKERVIPPCPPAVASAYLILRGAVAAVTGAAAAAALPTEPNTITSTINYPTVSVLQATYLKDQGALTGKFSVGLGRKLGDWCELDLPETDHATAVGACDAVLTAIEAAANRIITENRPIVCCQTTLSATIAAATLQQPNNSGNNNENWWGDDSYTTTNKKKPKDDANTAAAAAAAAAGVQAPPPILMAHIPDWVWAAPPGIPYGTTACGLSRIVLDRSQCSVSASSTKPRSKAEITLKFLVEVKEHVGNSVVDASATTLLAPVATEEPSDFLRCSSSSDDGCRLAQAKIRCPEGTALRDLLGALLAAAEAETQQPLLLVANNGESASLDTGTAIATGHGVHVVDASKVESANANDEDDDEMVVNVEEVKGKIDYTKLVDKFGSTLIDDGLLQELTAETVGKGRVPALHRFLRRGMFFSHRDLHLLLAAVKQGIPMYLYTGRGPSSESMHLGHLIPFLFTKWLQDAFDAPLVIQMTDDEKFIFKGVYDEQTGDDLNRFASLTIENARDIIACGFDYNKTFIFSDLDYVGVMYPNIVRIWKAVTTNAVTNIFGFDGTSNIGKIAFPAIQAAPSFASSFPKVLQANRESDHLCLIPCAIDQDPYFRMTRDVAHKLGGKKHKLHGKPALIHSKFFPPLQGATGKMSSSDENSAIFLTDSADDIKRKIMHHAFSGGRETKIKQQELGADLEVDVSYQWLRFFLEDDDELAIIGESYGSGKGDYWSTHNVKTRLIGLLQKLVAEHQQRRATVTDEEVRKWMTERSIL